MAAVSAALAKTEHHGLFHATSQGETSWSAYASEAAAILGIAGDKVQGVPTASLPMKAARPRRAILDNRGLRERGLDLFPSSSRALRAFIAEESRLT